jgi:uncharacterized protein YrrD
MHGYTIQATDGEIGTVAQFLFDDIHWAVRYLVVDTGGWLSGRRVLISPIAIRAARWNDQVIDVDLTRQQVEQSPGIETDQPVSRQKESEYAQYYGYAPYWGGAGVWGMGMYPGYLHPAIAPVPAAAPVAPATATEQPATPARESGDPHLRGTREVIGYAIQAGDGEIGQVDDFIVDDETWELRYMVVDTGNWLSGKKVLVAPRWISKVTWSEARVYVDLPRDMIKDAPEFDPYTPISRDYEARLYDHYQRPRYWNTVPVR